MVKHLKKTKRQSRPSAPVVVQALKTTSFRRNWDSFGPGVGTQRWILSPDHFHGFLRRDKTCATDAEREPPVERTAQECHSGHRWDTPSDCQFPEPYTTPTSTDDKGVQYELLANPSSIQPAARSHAHNDRVRLLRQCETAHPLHGLVCPVSISFELLERTLQYTGRTSHVLSITDRGSATMAQVINELTERNLASVLVTPRPLMKILANTDYRRGKPVIRQNSLNLYYRLELVEASWAAEDGLFLRLTMPTTERKNCTRTIVRLAYRNPYPQQRPRRPINWQTISSWSQTSDESLWKCRCLILWPNARSVAESGSANALFSGTNLQRMTAWPTSTWAEKMQLSDLVTTQ